MLSLSPAKRGRLILGATLLVAVALVLRSAQRALFPFVIGLFIVYLLLPVVNALNDKMSPLLRSRGLSRPLSILLVYLVLALLLVGFFAIFVPVVSGQVSQLVNASSQYTLKIFNWTKTLNQSVIDEWLAEYRAVVPDWIRVALEANLQQVSAFVTSSLQDLVSWLVGALQKALMGTLEAVTSTVGFVIGIVIVPFWVFYVLNDEEKLMRGVYSLIPERFREDAHSLQYIVGQALGAYLRGQLVLCLCVGMAATLGLLILGVNFSVLLGTVAAITEIVPNIGPILGAIPAVLVALLESPAAALQVAILYILIQQFENTFLVPKVTGASVRLHPALVMIVLVVAAQVGGLWGVVLGVPITAILRDVYCYLFLRFSDEEISPAEAVARLHPKKLETTPSNKWSDRLLEGGKRAWVALRQFALKAWPRLQAAGRKVVAWLRAAGCAIVVGGQVAIYKVRELRQRRAATAPRSEAKPSGTDHTA